jgi:hypothetical protein
MTVRSYSLKPPKYFLLYKLHGFKRCLSLKLLFKDHICKREDTAGFLCRQWGQWIFSEEKYSEPSIGIRYFPPSSWYLVKCLYRCWSPRKSAKLDDTDSMGNPSRTLRSWLSFGILLTPKIVFRLFYSITC